MLLSVQVVQQEVQKILEFESHLANATITQQTSHLLRQLTSLDPQYVLFHSLCQCWCQYHSSMFILCFGKQAFYCVKQKWGWGGVGGGGEQKNCLDFKELCFQLVPTALSAFNFAEALWKIIPEIWGCTFFFCNKILGSRLCIGVPLCNKLCSNSCLPRLSNWSCFVEQL